MPCSDPGQGHPKPGYQPWVTGPTVRTAQPPAGVSPMQVARGGATGVSPKCRARSPAPSSPTGGEGVGQEREPPRAKRASGPPGSEATPPKDSAPVRASGWDLDRCILPCKDPGHEDNRSSSALAPSPRSGWRPRPGQGSFQGTPARDRPDGCAGQVVQEEEVTPHIPSPARSDIPERLCARASCPNLLVRHKNEGPRQFLLRKYCSPECQRKCCVFGMKRERTRDA